MNQTRSGARTAGLAVLRAVVILVMAGIGYQLVVPVTQLERSRLSRLVVAQPGVKELDVKPMRSDAQPVDRSGLRSLVAAAKASPDQTGIYATEWVARTQRDAAQVAVILTPSPAVARRVSSELAMISLGANAETPSGLTRLSSSAVPGVPGSSRSAFGMTTKTGVAPELAAAEFRFGDVVVLDQDVAGPASVADAEAIARAEYRHLGTVEPGFSLSVTHRPALATVLWVAAAVSVAALAAGAPLALGRLRRSREQRRQEELDRIVRGHAITKTRRVQDR